MPKIKLNKRAEKCEACVLGKQTRNSFKSNTPLITSKSFELLHMDLFGPTKTLSLSRCHYDFVIVDDFSRFTWVFFLSHKSSTFESFENFFNKIEHGNMNKICSILTDHGGEFDNNLFFKFCRDKGSNHKFASPRTPEQNGVAEQKNRTLIEMARTMLVESQLLKYF